MNLYVDLATRRIVFSPKLNKELARVDVKRGDVYPLTIVFLSNGKPTQIAAGSVIAFCAKKKNDFDADPLVLSNSFTLSGAGTDDPKYNGVIQLNGEDLNDYLDNVSNKADDLVFADLHSEINWSAGGVSLTTNTLILRVYNDIYKDGDGNPELIVGQPFVFPNGLKIPSLTTGNVVLVGTDGLLQDISRSGIDTRSSFPPSSHTHGSITNDGKIGTTSNLVVITGAAGLLTTNSRYEIDTRTSFPNDDVAAATSNSTAGTIVKRDSDGAISLASSNTEGITLSISNSGNADNTNARAIQAIATGTAGIAGEFTSTSGQAIIATSDSSTALEVRSKDGTYHATFGNSGNNRSAIERVRGWFVWFYANFTGRLKTANITANRDWTLPNASGTIALTSDIVDSVTSATTSDGTANLSISNVTTATATVSSLLTANHIHGNIAGTLYTHVHTGEAVSKGDPVYVSGFHNGSGQPIVSKADASNPAKMPAIGVMDAAYAQNVSGANCVIAGTITSVDTDAFSVNSPVYVRNGGGFSETIGTIPQQVGIVERSNQNNGAFVVTNNKVISSADISDFATAVEAIAPNAVTNATTSDGTASLDISNLTLSQGITSGLQTKMVFTAEPTAVGDGQQIIWQWYNGGSPITTAAISSEATGSTTDKLIFKTTAGGSLSASLDLTNALATFSGVVSSLGATYQTGSTFTYNGSTAAAHRTALGLTTLATTIPAVNVATFLETPTSANLAAALTDENGTGGGFIRAQGATLTSPSFVGPVNLTSQDASTADRIMTRDLALAEEAMNVAFWHFGLNTSGGNSGTGSSAIRSGSTATGWGRQIITSNAMRSGASGGVTMRGDVPIAVAFFGAIDVAQALNGGKVRIIVGDTGNATGTPPRFGGQDALLARGFGAEVYWSTANARQEIRLFAYGASGYVVSTGAAFPNNYQGSHTVVVSSDGFGNIRLYGHTTGSSFLPPQRPVLLASLSGGPFGSALLGGSHITVVAVNEGTVAPTASDAFAVIVRTKVVINQLSI